ncbi:MAG: tetratricopeptide repeat protein, partial [Myxococcales bacterium]|nr:tetratricopeptide repeat protein [Myxococcales bacterium]
GVLALWQFHFDAADEALSAALFDAIAAGHDRIAADAAARLLYVKGVQSPDEAKRDLRLAAALVDKLRGAPEIEATYFNNLGVIYDLSGDIDEARAASERALELKRRIYGERHYEAGYSLSNLAMLDVTEGYHERARDRFVAAAAIFEETFGPDHPQTAALLSNLGNAYAHTGQWTRAAETYAAMAAIFAGSPASWSEMGPYILPDRGYFRLTLHHFDDAAADFREALRLLGDPPPADAPPVIQARVGLAAVAAARERWDEVDRRLAELATAMSADDPVAPFAVANAFDLRAQRRLLSADAARERPDQENTSTEKGENPEGPARARSPERPVTPETLENPEDSDSPEDDALALADHTRAFEIRAAKSPPGSPLRAHAHLELARALLRFDRLPEVEEHLAEARTIIDAELPSTSPERPALERLTAALELAKGDPEAATASLRRAVQLLDGAREPDDFDLALATFDLARALRRRDPTDPDARPLAERARSTLAGLGPGWRAEIARIDGWLAATSP